MLEPHSTVPLPGAHSVLSECDSLSSCSCVLFGGRPPGSASRRRTMPKEAEDLLGQANLLYATNRCAFSSCRYLHWRSLQIKFHLMSCARRPVHIYAVCLHQRQLGLRSHKQASHLALPNCRDGCRQSDLALLPQDQGGNRAGLGEDSVGFKTW